VSTVSSSSECTAKKPVAQGSKQGDVESRLAQVLCQLLEIKPSALSPESSLEDQGLDSLLSVELTSALEEAFACKLDAGSVHGDMTYNQLKGVLTSKVSDRTAGSVMKAAV
jgi:acyl carrier protein